MRLSSLKMRLRRSPTKFKHSDKTFRCKSASKLPKSKQHVTMRSNVSKSANRTTNMVEGRRRLNLNLWRKPHLKSLRILRAFCIWRSSLGNRSYTMHWLKWSSKKSTIKNSPNNQANLVQTNRCGSNLQKLRNVNKSPNKNWPSPRTT